MGEKECGKTTLGRKIIERGSAVLWFWILYQDMTWWKVVQGSTLSFFLTVKIVIRGEKECGKTTLTRLLSGGLFDAKCASFSLTASPDRLFCFQIPGRK
jgi:ABC-type uncharacterized transport system fused permease/ATPase subunit